MIIFKKDTKNKLRFLEIHAANGILYQSSGLLRGKKTRHEKACKPKNKGRSNATTAEEQATLEAEALIKKKLSEGYFISMEEADSTEVILPMLAKEYEKEKHKIDWSKPVFVQPKLDGMRALSLKDGNLISRKNKPINTLSHLQLEISELRRFGIDIPDGEVYAHGLTFQENMKLIKKYRPEETEKVCYHIYDHVASISFKERFDMLQLAFMGTTFKYLELVKTFQIFSEEQLKKFHRQFLTEGYEGTIIRYGDEPYKVNGRSSNLLKYKDFKDMDAKVIDVIASDARPEQGVIVCEGFKASLKFSHKEREEILKNKSDYIGKIANIRFFEYTDEGLPRFPVCVGFHEDR